MTYLRWLSAMLTAALTATATQAGASGQPLIIDHAFDTRPFIEDLKQRNVLVIGRYYARCVGKGQWEDKRMSRAEVDALLNAGFALLSIYQYWNNNAIKFDGMYRDWQGNVAPTLDEDCREAGTGRSAAEEGRLDAEAAVRQARAVGQPEGTAIYFGVDFDFPYKPDERRAYTEKMLAYFAEVNRILAQAGYRTGSYGSGYAHKVLSEAGLVELTWLSPSPAHAGSHEYYLSGAWTLFQANVDIGWFTGDACKGMHLDTNVENPRTGGDAGFWRRGGGFRIPSVLTERVFEGLRFVCDAKATIRDEGGERNAAQICKGRRLTAYPDLPHGQAVVTGPVKGDLVAVDMDHDGVFDGYTKALNLSEHFLDRPEWVRWAGPVCR